MPSAFTWPGARELLIRPIDRTVYLVPPYVLDPALSALLAERVMATLDEVLPESSTMLIADLNQLLHEREAGARLDVA